MLTLLCCAALTDAFLGISLSDLWKTGPEHISKSRSLQRAIEVFQDNHPLTLGLPSRECAWGPEGAFDEESGPQNAGSALPSTAVWPWRSYSTFLDFTWGQATDFKETPFWQLKILGLLTLNFSTSSCLKMRVVIKLWLSLCCQGGNNPMNKHMSFPFALGFRGFSKANKTWTKVRHKASWILHKKHHFFSVCIIWF